MQPRHAPRIYKNRSTSSHLTAICLNSSWLLYERPDFQGRIIALEEGATDLENEWAECGPETEPHNRPPILIGSIRLVVRVSTLINHR